MPFISSGWFWAIIVVAAWVIILCFSLLDPVRKWFDGKKRKFKK